MSTRGGIEGSNPVLAPACSEPIQQKGLATNATSLASSLSHLLQRHDVNDFFPPTALPRRVFDIDYDLTKIQRECGQTPRRGLRRDHQSEDSEVSVIAISALVCNQLPTTLHTKPYKEATVRRVHTIIIRIMRSMISNYEYTRRDRENESGAGTSLI